MNVLFLASWYPTITKPGFGIFVKEHAIAVRKEGCNVFVITITYTKTDKLLKIISDFYVDEYGINIYTIEVTGVFAKLLNYFFPFQLFLTKRIMKRLIKHNKVIFDVIHSNVVFPASISGYFIAKQLKIPHVITEHWSRISDVLKLPFLSALIRKSYIKSDAIMPVSVFLMNRMVSIIPALKIYQFHVVGNVVDTDLFYYKDKESNKSVIRFCAIATWKHKRVADKLPKLFMESLANVQNKVKFKLKLIMIGGGDQIDELIEFSKQIGLETEFKGFIEKSEICKILHLCDFLVHASTIETFGVGVAEALMTGTPVICSSVGALPELVNDANGILCENNTESWESGIIKALDYSYNHSLIAEDVKNRFSVSSIGLQITQVYYETIDKHKNEIKKRFLS